MSMALKANEYYEFIRWLAKPSMLREQDRDPLDQKELAEHLGVHVTTLSRWKQDPNFREDLRREVSNWAVQKTPDVIAALFFGSMKGKAPEIKLWLQYVEGFSEKTKVEHEGEVKQTVQIKVKEEKKIQIMAAFANFGILKEARNDQDTTTNTNPGPGRGTNRKPRAKARSGKGK